MFSVYDAQHPVFSWAGLLNPHRGMHGVHISMLSITRVWLKELVICYKTLQYFLLFLSKSQSFDFTNKDYRARSLGESLLSQRGRESIQLAFLLCCHSPKRDLSPLPFHAKLKLNIPPSYFLCISLFILLTPSYFLFFFFLSTDCLLSLLTYG